MARARMALSMSNGAPLFWKLPFVPEGLGPDPDPELDPDPDPDDPEDPEPPLKGLLPPCPPKGPNWA